MFWRRSGGWIPETEHPDRSRRSQPLQPKRRTLAGQYAGSRVFPQPDPIMTKPLSDSSFTTDVAKLYESALVPLIFRPYARDLAERAKALEPGSVLEVACGTGVVTRALASALPEECSIVATDLNDAMVQHGQRMGTSRRVTWRQAGASSAFSTLWPVCLSPRATDVAGSSRNHVLAANWLGPQLTARLSGGEQGRCRNSRWSSDLLT